MFLNNRITILNTFSLFKTHKILIQEFCANNQKPAQLSMSFKKISNWIRVYRYILVYLTVIMQVIDK